MKPPAAKVSPPKGFVPEPDPRLSPRTVQNVLRVFALLLAVPLLFEGVSFLLPSRTNLAAATVRSGMQWLLLNLLGEGNNHIFVGKEGWLFSHAELNRHTHARRPDTGLHAALLQLAAQLKAQDTPLLVVAIPDRTTLYPEQLRPGRYLDVIRQKDEAGRLASLKAAGAEVLDMTEPLWTFRDQKPVFFSHDSHWTPEAMKLTALAVHQLVREKAPRLCSPDTPLINATILDRTDPGDLALRLAPLFAGPMMGLESAELVSIQGLEPSGSSPVVLHGGELLRVYDDASLSFGSGARAPRAGFASQLATLIGRPLDVRGMPQPSDKYEDKKLVIILLPMADLVP
jgi:SGNH hydrolase-like domain, acetyltransferase AlgX